MRIWLALLSAWAAVHQELAAEIWSARISPIRVTFV